jgi:hypothetical protein
MHEVAQGGEAPVPQQTQPTPSHRQSSNDHHRNVLMPPPPPPPSTGATSSRISRLNPFFPLVKSRSSSSVLRSHASTPAIIKTSPTFGTDSEESVPAIPDHARLSSSSSIDNTERTRSSSPASTQSGTVNGTHIHLLSSATLAAVVGSSRIHLDDNSASRVSNDTPDMSSPATLHPPSRSVDATDTESVRSSRDSIFSKGSFFRRLIPSQLMRYTHRHRRKNHSIHSISTAPLPAPRQFFSVPASPKFPVASADTSIRSSIDDQQSTPMMPPPLPSLKSSASLPSTSPLIAPKLTSRSLTVLPSTVKSPARGRSSTVSSVSSDVQARTSRSTTRRASTIFTIKGRESGRGTPVEKLSLDEDETVVLPPTEGLSGEQYLNRIQSEEAEFPRYIRKLVDSSYFHRPESLI